MHLHILGICGTFMGGIALLARALGHTVTGSDANVYPPMSTQLAAAGIGLMEGYDASHLAPAPDLVVVGNAMKRGLPVIEYLLDRGLPYVSGPEWLKQHLLRDRWVLAVAGTHGKTTAASMLAWVLEDAGLKPGFLIGGVPRDFGISARLGAAPFFVVEADEYDTAFFDKRSKFVHYRPRTAILNNLEFDHADIFDDLAAIERQFHHLLRTVPASGRVVTNGLEESLDRVIHQGLWSELRSFGSAVSDFTARGEPHDFEVLLRGTPVGRVSWTLSGTHNQLNGLAAIAAAEHVGIAPAEAARALCQFVNVRRRLETRGQVLLEGTGRTVTIYDDFAHHPTAIRTTLDGLRRRLAAAGDDGRILAVFEPRSNTMKLGTMKSQLPWSLEQADLAFCHAGGLDWDATEALAPMGSRAVVARDIDTLVASVRTAARPGDHVVCMSNGGFGGIHGRLLQALAQ